MTIGVIRFEVEKTERRKSRKQKNTKKQEKRRLHTHTRMCTCVCTHTGHSETTHRQQTHTTTKVKKARQTFPDARWVPLVVVRGFENCKAKKLAKSLEHKLQHEIDGRGMAIRRDTWRAGTDMYVSRSDQHNREATMTHFRVAYEFWKNAKERKKTFVEWHTTNR